MKNGRSRETAFYHLARSLSQYYLTTYHHFRVEGADKIPVQGGAIFASNHASFFDPPAMAVATSRTLTFLARKTLFKNPLFGGAIRSLNAIPVDQENPDMTGLKNIIQQLRKGEMVVLFPEGSRTWDGELQPAQPGIGLVIEKSGVPVVPARLFGMHEAWPRGSAPNPFQSVQLVIGSPFIPTSSETDKRKRYADLANQVMDAIAAIEKPAA